MTQEIHSRQQRLSQADNVSTNTNTNPHTLLSKLRLKKNQASVRQLPDYEPSQHRTLLKPTNYCETLAHMIKASIGTGILAMPNAFANAGYIVGILGTIFIGVLCTYCLRTVVSVQYELCKRYTKPSLTYMETAQMSMLEGPVCCRNFKYMALIANTMIITFQVGCSCIYLIFVAKNVKMVLEHYMGKEFHLIVYMSVTVFLLFITALISNLKILAILSFLANLSTIGSFLILVTIILCYGHPTFEGRKRVGDIEHIPLFIGTVVFSMEAVGAVMPLENEMKEPLRFTSMFGVLHLAMFPTVTMYVLIGFLGYLNYGDEALGSITLNLPKDNTLANTCQLMMVFGIFSTHVLVLYITYKIIWKAYFEKYVLASDTLRPMKWVLKYLVRVVLIILTFCLSVIIPNLELLISLIGSLCLATAGIAFPALFNLYTYWEDYVGISFGVFFIWCLIIIMAGLLACLIGVYTSLGEIYIHVWSAFVDGIN